MILILPSAVSLQTTLFLTRFSSNCSLHFKQTVAEEQPQQKGEQASQMLVASFFKNLERQVRQVLGLAQTLQPGVQVLQLNFVLLKNSPGLQEVHMFAKPKQVSHNLSQAEQV